MSLPNRISTLLLAVVIFLLVPQPAALADPAPDLRQMHASRGSVPGSFPVEVCVDRVNLRLRNNLKVPIEFGATGAVADPVKVSSDRGVAASVTLAGLSATFNVTSKT